MERPTDLNHISLKEGVLCITHLTRSAAAMLINRLCRPVDEAQQVWEEDGIPTDRD